MAGSLSWQQEASQKLSDMRLLADATVALLLEGLLGLWCMTSWRVLDSVCGSRLTMRPWIIPQASHSILCPSLQEYNWYLSISLMPCQMSNDVYDKHLHMICGIHSFGDIVAASFKSSSLCPSHSAIVQMDPNPARLLHDDTCFPLNFHVLCFERSCPFELSCFTQTRTTKS